MKPAPLDIGMIHFTGIGGIGMSGIAEVMHNLGYQVRGSDVAENANVIRLRALGIDIAIGQRAENVAGAGVVVVSTAVQADNPEVVEARAQLLPVVRRAEMLAELMRLKSCVTIGGTHGKTTTTSIVAALLDAGSLDPTVINGGIINSYGTNARLGSGEWIVVEADESDGTFLKLPATIAVVTNIDPEHLDHYGSFERIQDAFLNFVEGVPFYGLAVMCIDHPQVQSLVGKVRDRRIVTYGTSPQADIRAENIRTQKRASLFDVVITDRRTGEIESLRALRLPMPGKHNVLNALAAIAVACDLGLDASLIRKGLEAFGGVKRRFSHVGSWNGADIFDDYGHHPVEISAVLEAARATSARNVIAVVQPHRYSRLRDLFDDFCACFNDADTVMVAPVFEAGETPLEGINSTVFAQAMRERGHRHVLEFSGPEALPGLVAGVAQKGDVVICLGAGSISRWADELPALLAQTGPVQKKEEQS